MFRVYASRMQATTALSGSRGVYGSKVKDVRVFRSAGVRSGLSGSSGSGKGRSLGGLRTHSTPWVLSAVGPSSSDGDSSKDSPGNDIDQNRRASRHTWDPQDSPLRDGNRDRLMGLLTERAARTLAYYLMETNVHLYNWWMAYLEANPPVGRKGGWEESRGDAFLKKLLSMPSAEVAWSMNRPEVFNIVKHLDINPRELATRVMDIRCALAKEFMKDLADVGSEENLVLLRETLMDSLNASVDEDVDTQRLAPAGPSDSGRSGPGSKKGQGQYKKQKRRKGRPAWERSPDDTPLRDGNRDRLIGLLTQRATRTLAFYLLDEANVGLYKWWLAFLRANPTPLKGDWDEICGDALLRKLLSMPGCESEGTEVAPRELATRVMDIRSDLAREFVTDLGGVKDENLLLLRESLMDSLRASGDEDLKDSAQ